MWECANPKNGFAHSHNASSVELDIEGPLHRSGTLRAWTEHLAARRGRRIAVVALARRLSRILYALWRDETEFNAATLAA